MKEIRDTIALVLEGWRKKQRAIKKEDPGGWLKKILTRKELRHIKIDYFRGGVLGVIVDSNVWLYSLGLRKEELLDSLRRESGIGGIKDIHFRIGELG